jgi:hypothetical protein
LRRKQITAVIAYYKKISAANPYIFQNISQLFNISRISSRNPPSHSAYLISYTTLALENKECKRV